MQPPTKRLKVESRLGPLGLDHLAELRQIPGVLSHEGVHLQEEVYPVKRYGAAILQIEPSKEKAVLLRLDQLGYNVLPDSDV